LYLVAPGLPQFTHRNFFKNKVDKNTAFFYLYYYGSWFSGDKFLFKNCIKSITNAITFIKNKYGVKTFDNQTLYWDYKNLFIIANSFGGNVVLCAKIDKKDVKKIFLYSPFFVEYSNTKSNLKMLNFLIRGYKNNFRGINSKEWKKYFTKQDKLSFVSLGKTSPMIEIIHGNNDISVPVSSSKKIQNKYPRIIKLILKNGIGHNFEKLYETQKKF